MPEIVLPIQSHQPMRLSPSEGSLPESPVLNLSRAEYSREHAGMSIYLTIIPSAFISLFEITPNGGQANEEHLQGLRQFVKLRRLVYGDLVSSVSYLVEQLHGRMFCR